MKKQTEISKLRYQMEQAEKDLHQSPDFGTILWNGLILALIMFFVIIFILITTIAISNAVQANQRPTNAVSTPDNTMIQFEEIQQSEASSEADDTSTLQTAKKTKYTQHGVASMYGFGEKLNPHTSCGNDFDPNVIAIAIPKNSDGEFCGKKARVTYNGKTIVALIWDTGPALHLGRIADLTKGAAEALGHTGIPTVITIDLEYPI